MLNFHPLIPITLAGLAAASLPAARAELKLPSVIGDHMVLQQKNANPIWGWDTPGTEVTVTFGGQTKTAKAGDDGRWEVMLDPVPANSKPAVLSVVGSSKLDVSDVLVGEVWMCSGQSNMRWSLSNTWNHQVEALAADIPGLRLMQVPNVGTQELKNDITASWTASTPDTAKGFSAVGFFYGKFLHEILDVPVGLINNSWGGSAAEAWVRRDLLENDERFASLIKRWEDQEADLLSEASKERYQKQLAAWKEQAEKAQAEGKRPPRAPRSPEQHLKGNHRPGNIFAGSVHPMLGYGIKGVIWYQGESNAGRAYEYADLFPFMIEQWRKEQGQGDFPFYWVQLADFRDESDDPYDSQWAELRESQTKTLSLPNTGQAVITDIGEGNDIHPRNKYDVAARLVRWALAKDYGFDEIDPQSPTFRDLTIAANKAVVAFDHLGGGLRTVDTNQIEGFAICGEDKKWHWADAKITGKKDTIEVWSDQVEKPMAVRYAWADNPVANVLSSTGLPLTPFRTDDFEMVTKPE